MTTATKLRLGFGLLIALFAISSILTIFRFQHLQRGATENVGIARDRRNEAVLLLLYVDSYDLAVRTSTQTGDPKYAEQAAIRANDVATHLAAYERFATTEAHRNFAERIGELWPAVEQSGQTILQSANPDREEFVRLADRRSELEQFLIYQVLPEALNSYELRRQVFYKDFQFVAGSALALLLLGMSVAVLTSWVVGRGIVKGEHDIREGRENLRVTLASIGDAVITSDPDGRVVFMNPVAESLTGWKQAEAEGRSLPEVFRIIDEATRKPVSDPSLQAARDGVVVALEGHALLVAKDGSERPIDDSAAPIRDEDGKITGVVLVFRDVAERKRADDSLRESERRFRQMIDALPAAVYTTDANGVVTHFNSAAVEVSGRMPNVGKDRWCISWKLYRPDGTPLPLDECPMVTALEEGRAIHGEQIIAERPDGTRRWLEIYPTPLLDDQGRVQAGINMLVDVTDRKRSEAAEAHLAAIVTSSHDAIISKDLNGVIRSWNDGARMLFGYTAEEAIGKPVTMLIPPHHLAEEPEIMRRVMNGEAIEFYDTVRKRKDGSLVDVSLTVSPVRDANGRIIGASKNARDISEQKRGARALHESAVRYSRLFESAHDGILIVDAVSGEIIDANANISAIAGIEQKDLIGRKFFEIGLAGDATAKERIFRELQQSGYLRHESSLRNTRGEDIQVEIVASVYHEQDRLLAQFNVRDIRERHQFQKTIKEQAELLAGESRRKDEFLAMLSHELRNPLAPIRSAVYLLKAHDRSDEGTIQRQAFDIIDRQMANLTKLVSDLLEVSRVVSGRVRLNLQTLDLKKILEHAIETAAPLIAQRKHELVVHAGSEPIWIDGDATRVEEILINLLSNAAKYTDEGGRVDVFCDQPKGRKYVEVRVRDNGIGIEPDLLPRIFDLFTQSDRTLARSEGGLGIGLNLAYRLVEMHGGTIDVQSPPAGQDRGSEFIVRLPVAAAPKQSPETEDAGDAARAPEGRRVLVVDDNVDQVTMLVSGLRHKGYAVQSAYTGPEGLKAALQWHPDVVVLDIGLPGLSGYEVARRVRSAFADDNGKMKLIALTGYGRDTDIALAHEAGFDVHLTKPCDFDQLEKLLAEATV